MVVNFDAQDFAFRELNMLEKKQKIESIQILRALAFFEIFLGHCGIGIFTGSFGVSVFVILSGFCMALDYVPKAEKLSLSLISNVKFALSKIKKMYWVHIVMLAAIYVIVKMPTSENAIRRIWINVFLVQGFTPHSEDYFSYNGVAWYLSTYLFICIFAPYIIKLISKCKNKKLMLIFAFIIYVVMIAVGYYLDKNPIAIGDDFARWFTYIFPGYRLLDFTMGAMLGWHYLNSEHKQNAGIAVGTMLECITAAVCAATVVIFHKMDGVWNGLCHTALFVPASLLSTFVFSECRGFITKLLNHPFFLWVGNLSAYTFLIHQVVIRWLRFEIKDCFGKVRYRIILTILSFVITMFLAQLAKYTADRRKRRLQIDNYNLA